MLSFEQLLKKIIAYSTNVSYYKLGSSSSNIKRDKYVNTWIRVLYSSSISISRSRARANNTENKKTRKINLILPPNPCVNVY